MGLGFPVAQTKIIGLTMILVFLSIEIDTVAWETRLQKKTRHTSRTDYFLVGLQEERLTVNYQPLGSCSNSSPPGTHISELSY